MTSYFVTAIGTDIGKTYASAAMLRAARQSGRTVSAIKPLMSGFAETALEESDAGQLLNAMGKPVTPQTVSEICLHRFEAPLAPNVAMRQAGWIQDYSSILDFVRSHRPGSATGLHLIEGAGGVMSPVTDTKTHLDLIDDLGMPILLVAAGYLGAVSHTLTALACLEHRGIDVAGLIVSQPAARVERPSHLIREIGLWSSVECFALSFDSPADHIVRRICKAM